MAPSPAEGTGSSATTESGDIVSLVDISHYKAGTPAHTVLDWWRLAQLNEPEAARSLYVEEPPLPDLAGQFNYVEGHLVGTVKVLSTKEKGSDATVVVKWDQPQGPPAQESLELEEVGGAWKLAGVRFLDEMVKEMQAKEAG